MSARGALTVTGVVARLPDSIEGAAVGSPVAAGADRAASGATAVTGELRLDPSRSAAVTVRARTMADDPCAPRSGVRGVGVRGDSYTRVASDTVSQLAWVVLSRTCCSIRASSSSPAARTPMDRGESDGPGRWASLIPGPKGRRCGVVLGWVGDRRRKDRGVECGYAGEAEGVRVDYAGVD